MGGLCWAEVRRRWRAALGVALVLTIGATAALTAAAGARRTDTAYPRMLTATAANELVVSGYEPDPRVRGSLYRDIAELDGVERDGAMVGVYLVPVDVPRGEGAEIQACSILSADGVHGYEIDRANVLEGRLPEPDSVDEVLVSKSFADTFGVGAGDELDLIRPTGDDVAIVGEAGAGDGPEIHVHVVGVGVSANEIVPLSDLQDAPTVFAGPAFVERHAPDPTEDQCFDGATLRVADGTDLGALAATIDRVGGTRGGVLIQDRGGDTGVRQAIRPQVTALYMFAGAVALIMTLVVTQLLARQSQQAVATSGPVLRAVGATRLQVVLILAAPGLLTALVGAGAALVGSMLLSGRFPVGPARLAETDRGIDLHAPIHLGGAALLLGVTAAISVVAAAVALRARAPSERLGWLVRLGAATSRPAVLVGLNLATGSRRGRAPVPVRSAALGTALAIAAVAATVTFAAGLDQLVSDPTRYGKDWDVMVDGAFGPAPVGALLDALADDEAVEAMAGGRYGDVTIDGHRTATVGLIDLVGVTFPTIIDGRAPEGADEIAIGSSSLGQLDRSIGDVVEVDTGLGPKPTTIVATAVFPRLNHGSFSTLGLGVGAMTRTEAFPPNDAFLADAPPDFDLAPYLGPGGTTFEFVTIRMRSDSTHEQRTNVMATVERLSRGDLSIRTEQRPIAIDRYAEVRSTPFLLAAVMGAMAAATLAHLVISVVLRRRRDLALCSALGMRPAQILRAVVVQAFLIAAVALLIGLPAGIVAGSLAWDGFAAELGVAGTLALPLPAIGAAAALTALVAVSVSAIPAALSSRLGSATVLRSD